MNILKRELAPISESAWKEIDLRTQKVLQHYLSARKFVKVEGPKGLDFTAVTEGRIKVHDDNLLHYGLYNVKPLIEPRVSFKLERWELDNIERGAKDINWDSLDKAVKKIASFEEKVIFKGLTDANIVGLEEAAAHQGGELGNVENEILSSITKGVMILERSVAEKPYALVVSEDIWCKLNALGKEESLVERIEKIISGKIVVSRFIKEAFLLPYDNDNIELTIGEDLSIGYQEHSENEVKLFITGTFTFRVLDCRLIVQYK